MLPTITIDPRFHLNKVGPTRLLGLLTDKWLHHVGKGEVPRALVNPPPLKTRTPEFDAALLELKIRARYWQIQVPRRAVAGLRSPPQCQQHRGNQQETAESQRIRLSGRRLANLTPAEIAAMPPSASGNPITQSTLPASA